jgi:undecaprenyl-diphosphatase
MLDWIIELDKTLFFELNSYHNTILDVVMWWISSKAFWIPFYIGLFILLIAKYKKEVIRIILFVFMLILLTDQISTQVFKKGIQRKRPSREQSYEEKIHLYKQDNGNYYKGGEYGFVSSHAANTFGLAVFMALLFRKKWFTAGFLLWATIVSYSRIYLGVHYPLDIIGGALLGAGFAYLLFKLYQSKYLRVKKRPTK